MKIIFVGLHNKPDKMPLCHTTKTGKLVSRIIKNFPTMEILKTNLFNVDYYPRNSNGRYELAMEWTFTYSPDVDDIIVLLGAATHKNFQPTFGNVIKAAHPASKRSHKDMDDYVRNVSNQILDLIKPKNHE